jgi:hypothetical protein
MKLSKSILSELPDHRGKLYVEYYGLDFDEHGCPVKLVDGKPVFHPILAAYLISDLALAHQGRPSGPCLRYANAVADRALERATNVNGSLVFYYESEDGLSYVPGKFYSALTQAWFVIALCRLNRISGSFGDQIRSIFNSLTIPIEDGGTLIRRPYGWVVEEYPHDPPLYTLNGWLSVLRWIIRSARDLEKLNIDVHGFLANNISAAAHLLPLFDAEFCKNSRYQLTGFTRIQLISSRPADFWVKSFSVEIPGEGTYPGDVERKLSRWKNFLERNEGRLRQFNVVLSLISFPKENVFRAVIETSEPCSIRFRLAKGSYRPDSTAMPTETWDDILSLDFDEPGTHSIEVPVPFDDWNMFAYPTNFKKKIDGRFFNAYHFIHILACAEIYQYCEKDIFREFCLRFLSYYKRWPEIELSDEYSLEPHIPGRGDFESYVTDILEGRVKFVESMI